MIRSGSRKSLLIFNFTHQKFISTPHDTTTTLAFHVAPSHQGKSRRTKMPLDTSSYALSLLRLDGRRWNELRRIHAQISTQPAADGSSYLEMGNTKVLC